MSVGIALNIAGGKIKAQPCDKPFVRFARRNLFENTQVAAFCCH